MSRCLSDRGIEHVILERGRIAERWRSERWDSLQLLTPNWQSRLPGFRYEGPDPDGYMTMPQVVAYLERYANVIDAPIEAGTTVLAVQRSGREYLVETDRGSWRSRGVVVATGHSDLPLVPPMAAALSNGIVQVVPTRYRNPRDLPEGGVLVVGASATGIQLADEIHSSGRPVTLAVGRHMRLPRRYRGRDILWWLDAMGVFDETIDRVYDSDISRSQPSLQPRIGEGVGAIATNDDTTCVFVAVPAARFQAELRHDLASGHRRVLAQTAPDIAERVEEALQVGPLRGFPGQESYCRQSWGPGWALVGDAGYFKDPFTAHGITDALRDAEILADAVAVGSGEALASYQATRDRLSAGLFSITDRIASFEWDLETVKEWHHELSREMQRENAMILELDASASAAAAQGVSR